MRPSFSLGETTFHFLDASPAEALARAREAADGRDVRLGGGPSTVRAFFEAGLIDTLHVAVAPVRLGRGQRLWNAPEDFSDGYHHESVPSPSGVVHHLYWRH